MIGNRSPLALRRLSTWVLRLGRGRVLTLLIGSAVSSCGVPSERQTAVARPSAEGVRARLSWCGYPHGASVRSRLTRIARGLRMQEPDASRRSRKRRPDTGAAGPPTIKEFAVLAADYPFLDVLWSM